MALSLGDVSFLEQTFVSLQYRIDNTLYATENEAHLAALALTWDTGQDVKIYEVLTTSEWGTEEALYRTVTTAGSIQHS